MKNKIGILTTLLLGISLSLSVWAIDEILIAYVGELNSEARRGVELGLNEANTQGKFLGLTFKIINNPSPLQARVLGGFHAIASDSESLVLRALTVEYDDIPIFNLAERSETLREECHDNLLHVITSEEMLDDAINRWQNGRSLHGQMAIGWHFSLKKYAASQLNKRYQEKFHEPMNETAWAGWASIKIISDTIARAGNSKDLLYALKNHLKFDGQKGIGMTFRENGQLRQPVLIVENDKVVGEIPRPGIQQKNQLDSLGTTDCYK